MKYDLGIVILATTCLGGAVGWLGGSLNSRATVEGVMRREVRQAVQMTREALEVNAQAQQTTEAAINAVHDVDLDYLMGYRRWDRINRGGRACSILFAYGSQIDHTLTCGVEAPGR